jgi:Type II secretion system (T2SS), protein K
LRRRGAGPRPSRGYVLVLVLGALALIALIAARFAQRIDDLSRQTATMQAHARDRLEAGNALAAALYLVTTRPLGPGGHGPALEPELRSDDRLYKLPSGGLVQVQDQRGLLPLNAVDRPRLAQVLRGLGVSSQDSDSWIDILQDYQDTDTLKRLNGAEGQEYEALGLLPPRNDWMISVRELNRMPRWRDQPAVVGAIERIASTGRQAVLNPNTAPIEVLGAALPAALPEQLELFDTLRKRAPFLGGTAAQRATGLPFERDDFIFHTAPQLRITVSAASSKTALQYNVTLIPGGLQAPWLISEARADHRADHRHNPDRAIPLPLAVPEANKP